MTPLGMAIGLGAQGGLVCLLFSLLLPLLLHLVELGVSADNSQ